MVFLLTFRKGSMISKLAELPSDTSRREESEIRRSTQVLRLLVLGLICLSIPLSALGADPDDGFDEAVIQRCDSFRSPRSAMAPPPEGPTGLPIWNDLPSAIRLLETLLAPDLNNLPDRHAQLLRASRLCARSRIGRLAWLQREHGSIPHCVLAAALPPASKAV